MVKPKDEKKFSPPPAAQWPPKLHTIYDPPGHPGLDCSHDEPITEQAHKESCDINEITRKYERTGELPDMIDRDPEQWGDFSSGETYHEAMNIVTHANQQFDALPAQVRKRFDNDPQKFLQFFEDPANLDEMAKLGLAKRVQKASEASTGGDRHSPKGVAAKPPVAPPQGANKPSSGNEDGEGG